MSDPRPFDQNPFDSFNKPGESDGGTNPFDRNAPPYSSASYRSSSAPMPRRGLYIFWLIVGFACGVLWGALSIAPFRRMNAAIARDDSYDAWANAEKVRMFALIGIGVNVLFLIIRLLLMR